MSDFPCTAGLIAPLVRRHLDVATLLVEAGASVNPVDNEGYSPLAYAATSNQPECVRRLLRAGADMALADTSGRVVLHYAAQYGFADVVHALAEADFDPTPLDVDGDTPLFAAATAEGAEEEQAARERQQAHEVNRRRTH